MNKKITKIIYILLLILLLLILTMLFSQDILNFMGNLSNSFYRTIIEEKRYILLLRGLCSTLLISITSIIFGTVLGLIICYFRRSKNKILKTLSKIYINLIQGIPITVLLLTFYYIIFGKVKIEPNIVAILTFSLYFSGYTSEIFRGALDTINTSQVQSAYALGFTKFQTLRFIIFPQALSYVIPVYKNEIVTLIKLTSITGYISIMDLTKASDIIRNRTYEAFFPLIITAIIYFIICYFIGKILDIIYAKVNPRKNVGGKNVKNR